MGKRRTPGGAALLVALLWAFQAADPSLAGAQGRAGSRPDLPAADDVYDPYEGMDKSGRIPAIEKPADLPNPDRWRYIPEGRIKPGNFFERFLVTSFIVPVVFRNPDTGIGGGIGITDIDFRQQRRREFAGFFLAYTTKKQQSYWGLWRRWLHHRDLPEGGVLQEERSFIGVSGGYQKTLTRRFFGYGATSSQDDQIRYTDKLLELEVEMDLAIPEPGANLVGSLALRGEYHSLSTDDFDCDEFGRPNQDPSGSRICPGDWDQTFRFRGFIENDDHERNGYLVTGLRWDTRDSQRNPYEGYQVGIRAESPLLQNNWDVGSRITFDAATAFAVPGIFHSGAVGAEENPPTDVIAFGAQYVISVGDMPFTGHPTLGGSVTLRGYQAGRFRDDAAWHAGVEHRLWVIPRGFELTPTIRVERIGIAPFVEVGTVGSNGLDTLRNRVRLSYGVGLRILLERAAPFRVDFGFSEEGFNWVARFGLTF